MRLTLDFVVIVRGLAMYTQSTEHWTPFLVLNFIPCFIGITNPRVSSSILLLIDRFNIVIEGATTKKSNAQHTILNAILSFSLKSHLFSRFAVATLCCVVWLYPCMNRSIDSSKWVMKRSQWTMNKIERMKMSLNGSQKNRR